MKRVVAAALCAGFAVSPVYAGEVFEKFCVAVVQDNPDACHCGQLVADGVLSPPEQQVLVRVLSGEAAEEELSEAGLSREAFDTKASVWDRGVVGQCYS